VEMAVESQTELLKRAAYLGEDIVCVRPDQPDGAHHDDQDHGEHHGVLGYVLTVLFDPKMAQILLHFQSPKACVGRVFCCSHRAVLGQPGKRRTRLRASDSISFQYSW